MKLDLYNIAAISAAVFLAAAFTWIALLSRDKYLLVLAWLSAALVAGLGYLEAKAGSTEGV